MNIAVETAKLQYYTEILHLASIIFQWNRRTGVFDILAICFTKISEENLQIFVQNFFCLIIHIKLFFILKQGWIITGRCADFERGEWKCLTTPQCIQRTMLCDSQYQCRDLSDESICTHYFDCNTRKYYRGTYYKISLSQICIPSLLVCDGVSDCFNHADEQYCNEIFWNKNKIYYF